MARALEERLGLRPGADAVVIGRPDGLAELAGVADDDGRATAVAFQIAFVRGAADVPAAAERAAARYRAGGHLWMVYPKKTGAIRTDITRDRGWGPLVERGFLPVTQVAVDDTWSALRFRRREEIGSLTRTMKDPV